MICLVNVDVSISSTQLLLSANGGWQSRRVHGNRSLWSRISKVGQVIRVVHPERPNRDSRDGGWEGLRQHPDQDNPPSGARGHIKRLLACTILLRNGAYVNGPYRLSEEDFFLQTSAASLIRLTGSALALEIPALGLGFMLWLFEAQPHPGLRPFIAFCALALAAALGFGKAPEQEIIQACSWVDAEEARSRDALGNDVDSERWLIGINSYEGPSHRDKDWLFVAKHVFEKPQGAYSAQIRETLRRFSHQLTGG